MQRSVGMAIMIALVASCRTANATDLGAAAPLSCHPPTEIRFPSDMTNARFGGTLERWQQDCFVFSARQGQHVRIALTDDDNSASLSLYAPGFVIRYGNPTEEGRYVTGWSDKRIPINTYKGVTLTVPSGQQASALQSFAGRLPTTGRYLIVVGLEASGGSTFDGRLSIR